LWNRRCGSRRRRLVGVSGRRSGGRPPLLIFPAIYGVNPEFEPRGNELTRLTDVLCASGMPPAKDRHLIMIKYPVLAITSAGFCCSQGFPQIGAKGRNFHTDARRLRSVASRSAASVQPRPTLGFRCGRRGFVVFRGTTLGTEGVSDNTTGIDRCRVDWASGRIVRSDEHR
jgi:hypothetical protein